MQRLEVSGVVRLIYRSLGVKRLIKQITFRPESDEALDMYSTWSFSTYLTRSRCPSPTPSGDRSALLPHSSCRHLQAQTFSR